MTEPNQVGMPIPELRNRYVYFVLEREHIRTEKEAGAPAPWSEDDILNTYKFCNMRRADDRVSRWLIDNWYGPYRDYSLLWFMPIVARWINWPPTLDLMLQHDAWEQDTLHGDWFDALGAEIDHRVQSGEKAWTGAYLITARTLPEGRTKGDWIANSTLKNAWFHRDKFNAFFQRKPEYRTVEEAMGLFKGMFNFGTFMAGQVVADWTYTHLLCHAPDLYTFAPIGPGSTRGLNRLFGRGLDKPIKQAQFNSELIACRNELSKYMDVSKFTLHDIQNTFCEFDKYCRLINGGQVRSKYTPETRF
jgi:hypothetical protein